MTAKDSNIISVGTSACVHLCIQIISCLYLLTTICTVVFYYNNSVLQHDSSLKGENGHIKPSIEAASKMKGAGVNASQ